MSSVELFITIMDNPPEGHQGHHDNVSHTDHNVSHSTRHDAHYDDDILSVYRLYAQILASCMLAAAGAIFYKKSFNRAMIPLVLTLVYLAIAAHHFAPEHPITTTLCLAAFSIKLVLIFPDLFIRSSSFVYFYIPLFLVLAEAQTGALSPFMSYELRIIFTSSVQFIRTNKYKLKARLQGVRSKLGPIYIIYLCHILAESGSSGPVIQLLCVISAGCAALAGTVFRPDNKAIIDLVHPGTVLIQRKYYHARLMIISLSAFMVLSTYEYIVSTL